LYIFFFMLTIYELILDVLFLSNIPTKELVLCCTVIFGVNSIGSKIPFDLPINTLLILFYMIYSLIIFLNLQKKAF
ncbi:hypothetical protein ACN091_10900, partial [Aliarcobacter butzleri]